ncbi:VOC family protein [Peterkaempfera griseoplana]|uniref:VOC family protein n=1 Tax=Peterkaempfera griseoplana TaxID=66896 RepID=UPI0006E34219|nr:VOC family protein [Peterkaempfera griseoplana]
MAGFVEGAPCWVDVVLPDLEAGRRFYGELFGWTFRDGGEEYGSYTEALSEGRSVAALLPVPADRAPGAAWNLHFAVADAAAFADKVAAAGGKVVSGPTRIGDVGTLLVFTDPGGAAVGAWQAGTREGFEVQGEPGSFFWPEIYTRDKATVDPFYETVFGYAGQQVAEGAEFDFKIWSLGHPVAGRLQMNEYYPAELGAHALVYFRVADTDAAVAKVRSLGGTVTREPSDSPFGRSALVVDDQGARFALMGPASGGDAH